MVEEKVAGRQGEEARQDAGWSREEHGGDGLRIGERGPGPKHHQERRQGLQDRPQMPVDLTPLIFFHRTKF